MSSSAPWLRSYVLNVNARFILFLARLLFTQTYSAIMLVGTATETVQSRGMVGLNRTVGAFEESAWTPLSPSSRRLYHPSVLAHHSSMSSCSRSPTNIELNLVLFDLHLLLTDVHLRVPFRKQQHRRYLQEQREFPRFLFQIVAVAGFCFNVSSRYKICLRVPVHKLLSPTNFFLCRKFSDRKP